MLQVQVTDESAHEPSLAHTRRECKTQGREFTLEIRDRRIFTADSIDHGGRVGIFSRSGYFCDAVEDFQRLSLGRAQGEAAANGVYMSIHLYFFLLALDPVFKLPLCLFKGLMKLLRQNLTRGKLR